MDKYVNNTPAKLMRYQIRGTSKAKIIEVIFKTYAHFMGEVEIDGLDNLDAVSIYYQALINLGQRVGYALEAAQIVGNPVPADLVFMVDHIHAETSVCRKCNDRGCIHCDSSMY